MAKTGTRGLADYRLKMRHFKEDTALGVLSVRVVSPVVKVKGGGGLSMVLLAATSPTSQIKTGYFLCNGVDGQQLRELGAAGYLLAPPAVRAQQHEHLTGNVASKLREQ